MVPVVLAVYPINCPVL